MTAPDTDSSTADRVLFAGGSIFDSISDTRYRADVLVEGGLISQVIVGGATPSEHAGHVVDVTGSTVLPGLIDAHTHVGIISLSTQNTMAPAVQAGTIFRTLSSALDQGFTTLRDLGGVDGGLVEAIDQGLISGPRVLPSGQIISQSAGHGDSRRRHSNQTANETTGSGGLTWEMRIADGVEEVRRAARDQFRKGATQLKVFASGGMLSEGDPIDSPQYSVEELAAVVEVAADRNTYVTAHAHTVRGIHRAVEAGIRCFEHATIIDSETVELLASVGASVIPTLTISEMLRLDASSMGVPEEWLHDAPRLRDSARESILMLDAAGVLLGSGADLIGDTQVQRGWEIALKADILGAAKAIKSATRVNAQILGIADEVGTIEAGMHADLVVFAGDPVADPTLFRTTWPTLVYRHGVLVSSAS
jgi:imidazolonepropionase-like amidohydrolase